MKKKILGSVAVLSVIVMAAVNIQLNSTDNNLSSISLANVEILAYGDPSSNKGCKQESKSVNTSIGNCIREYGISYSCGTGTASFCKTGFEGTKESWCDANPRDRGSKSYTATNKTCN